MNEPVLNHGNFCPLEKGVLAKNPLLPPSVTGQAQPQLDPLPLCGRDAILRIERERERGSVTLAMILVINYLENFCPLLLTLLYLNSLGSRHASLICLAFEFFEGFKLMNTKDNVVA